MFELMIFLLIATFSPGPNNLISLHLAMQSNMMTVAKYITATFFGFLIVLSITGFGHLFLSDALPRLTHYVKYIGFAFILYLAYKILFHSQPITDDKPPSVTWKYGFTLQFINPKIWLAGLTTYSVYIFKYSDKPTTILLAALGMSVLGVLSQWSWALMGLVLKKYYNKYYKIINIIMALMLLYLAISIVK